MKAKAWKREIHIISLDKQLHFRCKTAALILWHSKMIPKKEDSSLLTTMKTKASKNSNKKKYLTPKQIIKHTTMHMLRRFRPKKEDFSFLSVIKRACSICSISLRFSRKEIFCHYGMRRKRNIFSSAEKIS